MFPNHVRADLIIVGNPLRHDVIDVPLAEENELEQAFVFDRLNEAFHPTIGLCRRVLPIGVPSRDGFA